MKDKASLLDGRRIAQDLRQELKQTVSGLRAAFVQPPGLAILVIGDDPATQVYIQSKERACQEVGIISLIERLPQHVEAEVVRERIHALNHREDIHGILIQLPLPAQLDAQELVSLLDPAKDVDGFHPQNQGRLLTGAPGLVPCTPKGIMALLARHDISLGGQDAVIIGRSNIVGKPMALLLLAADATVTLCHRRTRDLPTKVRQADLVVAAAGQSGLVEGNWIKPGATVIDVGTHRGPDGKLVGDVRFEEAAARARWITPVPGGVGPMTVAMLLTNTVEAFRQQMASLQL